MILVDSSIWIDYLRAADPILADLLNNGRVLAHPFVIGELRLGSLRNRDAILGLLRDLPQAPLAQDSEVAEFIERRALFGRGIGYVDAHLLASMTLTAGASLWTRDRRLAAVAFDLGLSSGPGQHQGLRNL